MNKYIMILISTCCAVSLYADIEYYDLKQNIPMKLKAESCKFSDNITIQMNNANLSYQVDRKKVLFPKTNDEFCDDNNICPIVIGDIDKDGTCDLLGFESSSSQVNQFFTFFAYDANKHKFNSISVSASNPSIDFVNQAIVSNYRDGARWWIKAFCKANSYQKCIEGFWIFSSGRNDIYSIRNLKNNQHYFTTSFEHHNIQKLEIKTIDKTPFYTNLNANKKISENIEAGYHTQVLNVNMKNSEVFYNIRYKNKEGWIASSHVDIFKVIHDDQSAKLISKSYLYKSPTASSKTKMYLIKGDKVEVLEEKGDWLHIVYHGKKDIKAWIPKSAVE